MTGNITYPIIIWHESVCPRQAGKSTLLVYPVKLMDLNDDDCIVGEIELPDDLHTVCIAFLDGARY